MGVYFDVATKFINDAIKSDGKVYVHCMAGISRSPTIVIAYLMKYEKMNLDDAYNFVKSRRWIGPNTGFVT